MNTRTLKLLCAALTLSACGEAPPTAPVPDVQFWVGGNVKYSVEERVVLRVPDGGRGEPRAINAEGQIVGWTYSPGDYGKHAVLWDNGKMVDIHLQGWLESEAHDLNDAGDIVGIADALADLLYVVYGTVDTHGLSDKMPAIFSEVHRSNMSKLGEDGRPIYRSDGKVLKGPNYSPPAISDILSERPRHVGDATA